MELKDFKIERELAGRKVVFDAICSEYGVYCYLSVPDVNQYLFSGWAVKEFKILHIQINSVHDSIKILSYEHFSNYVDKFLEKITPLNAKRLVSEETQIRDMYYDNSCHHLSQLLDDDTFELIEDNDIPDYLIYRINEYKIPENFNRIPYADLELNKYRYSELKRKGYYFGR